MPSLGLGIAISDGTEFRGSRLRIAVDVYAVADDAAPTDPAGAATLVGNYTGTASWSLADDAGGKYAINSSTGAITVAGALSAGVDAITVSVSGVTPTVSDKTALIFVTSTAAGTEGQPMGMLLTLTYAA